MAHWKWFYAENIDSGAVPVYPDDISASDLIRKFDCREVYRKNGYYFKQYDPVLTGFRAKFCEKYNPSAAREFKQLRMLARLQMPAVKAVGYGVLGTKSVLITAEAANTQAVADYLNDLISEGKPFPEEFLRSWGRFVRLILQKRLYLPDSHPGNMLCNPADNSFMLVDPFGIKVNFFTRRTRVLRMLKRLFASVVEFGTRRDLLILLEEAGEQDPAAACNELMRYTAHYVQSSQLQKRLKRFRKKQDVRDGIMRRTSQDLFLYPLEHTEIVEVALQDVTDIWELDYICSLYRLPMLHTVARVPDSGRIYRQIPGRAAVDPDQKKYLEQLLELYKLPAEKFTAVTDRFGRTVLADSRTLRRA